MALQKTPDGKYTYESTDPAQVEAIVTLYEPDAKEKARQVLARAAAARGEALADTLKAEDAKGGKSNA